MNLLLFSGNNKRGKQWLKQVEANLSPLFDQTYAHDYAHWASDQPEIDLDEEEAKLAGIASDLDPYIIFAKSAGTILTAKASAEGILSPKASLFVGFPLIMIRDHNLPAAEWLRATSFPIRLLQHSRDPFGSYFEATQYLEETARPNVLTYYLPGDTHDYQEFEVIASSVRQLLKLDFDSSKP